MNGKHGTAVINIDNTLTYTPNAKFNGTDTITYQVCDLDGDCSTAQIIVTVVSTNHAPVLMPPSTNISTTQGTPLEICFTVTDADSDLLTATPLVKHGTVVASGNNCFIYTPDNSYLGLDTLQISFCDPEGACASGSVSLTILSIGIKPVAKSDTIYLVTSIGQEANGCIEMLTAIDGLVASILTNPDHGELTIENQLCVKYKPIEGFTGNDYALVTICNGQGLCDTVVIAIEIIPVKIPNGFSPNGDGHNDVFEIQGGDYFNQVSLQVFNRWGNKVFESGDYKNDWDGTSKNAMTLGSNNLPTGTYFYVVDFHNGKKPTVGYVYISR
jgi:gliding motility-associated-like protein